jgi:hypothetical protein
MDCFVASLLAMTSGRANGVGSLSHPNSGLPELGTLDYLLAAG